MRRALSIIPLVTFLSLSSIMLAQAGPLARFDISQDEIRAGNKLYFDASDSESTRGTKTGLRYRWKFRQGSHWTKIVNYPWMSYIPSFSGTEVAWLEVIDSRTSERDQAYKTYQVIGNSDQKGFRDWDKAFRGGIARHDRTDRVLDAPKFNYSPQFYVDLDLSGRNEFEEINDRVFTTTEGTQVQFSARSESKSGFGLSGEQYRWDFEGDGKWDTEFGSEKTPQFFYQNFGTYYPTVEVVLPSGERSFSWVKLDVKTNTPVKVTLETPDQILPGEKFNLNVTLFDEEHDDSDFLVRFDLDDDGVWDQGFSTDKEVEWVYFEPGEKEIAIEVTDRQGKVRKVKKKLIVGVTKAPEIHVTVSDKALTVGEKFNFNISKSEGFQLKPSWKVPEVFGEKTFGGTEFSVYFETLGEKQIELDVTDGFGQTKQVRIPVWVVENQVTPDDLSGENTQPSNQAENPSKAPETQAQIDERLRHLAEAFPMRRSVVSDYLAQQKYQQEIAWDQKISAPENLASGSIKPGSLSEVLESITAGNVVESETARATQNFIGSYQARPQDEPGSDETVIIPTGTPVIPGFRPLYDASEDPMGDYDGPMRPGRGPWIAE